MGIYDDDYDVLFVFFFARFVDGFFFGELRAHTMLGSVLCCFFRFKIW